MNKEAAVAAAGGSIHDFRKATRKMRWWYESLADYMIAYPTATQNDLAAQFGRQPATISTIINTDAFKAYYRQRRAIHTEKLDSSVREKLFKVTDKSLDQILSVLDKKRDTIPLEMLQRVADSSLKNLGYGVTPPQGATTVNVNAAPSTVHVAVSLSDLEAARAALRRNQMMAVDRPLGTVPHDADRVGMTLPDGPWAGPHGEDAIVTYREIENAEKVRSDTGSGEGSGVERHDGEAEGREDLQRGARSGGGSGNPIE